MGATESQLAISYYQLKFNIKTELYLIEMLVKVSWYNTQITQAIVSVLGGSPQTDCIVPMLKTISTKLIKYCKFELVTTWSLHTYIIGF